MGSSNCPETPRQRMIGMMYLVLTALLALNVSKEILDSFLIVNESLVITNENFTKKIEGNYAAFSKALALSKAKVQPYYDKAMQAKAISKDMVDFINKCKADIISLEGGIPVAEADTINIRNVSARDKYDQATHYFIGESQDGSAGQAGALKIKIQEFKKKMLDLIDPKYRNTLKLGLNVEGPFYGADGEKHTWEMHNFYHTIMAADVVILNKLIAEVKNAEFDVVAQLYTAINVEDFKFDQIGAKVVPKSTYVLTGESFEADIFVAAYDTKQTPEIIVGSAVDSNTYEISGEKITVEGVNGVGKLKLGAGGIGVRTYGGVINVTNPSGGTKSYPFSGEYVVAQPSATISPTKMNVFYIGVPNPVSISVPGVANANVRVTITGGGGSIAKAAGDGQYTVTVTTPTTAASMCKVTVSAAMGGSTRSMGSMDFRVKRVPDPVAYIAGTKGGPVSKGALMASPLIPRMENFDFDLQFTIISFSLTMSKQGDLVTKQTTGNQLSAEMKSMIQNAGKNQKVYIEDIKAKGPDGSTRNLGTISLKII
ncbi:MAG: gliding motility protein GldM [Bacteroidota bacterium]